MTRTIVILSAFFLVLLTTDACRTRTQSYTAEITLTEPFAEPQQLSGNLYLSGDHIRVDWGLIADVFDLKQRTGWRLWRDTKTYQQLGSKDLSTFAPEMIEGSLCPHTQVPSQCKLIDSEVLEGRSAKKWDVYNPKGFHVYYWTDAQLGITLRMAMGEGVVYQATNFRQNSVSSSMFQVPTGYQKVERPFKP